MTTLDFPVTADADVDSTVKNRNDGALDTMLVDGAATPASALWRVELSDIPSTASVMSAELHLTTSNDIGDPCYVYELVESWSEASVTWSSRAKGSPWLGAGATPPSRGAIVQGGPIDTSQALTELVVAIDVALVARWVNAPAQNFGAAMTMETSDGATFKTREDSVVSQRPFLRVSYAETR